MFLCFLGLFQFAYSQDSQMNNAENVRVATFGNMSELSCVDDDFSQTLFISIPNHIQEKFYLRIFDPDCGGENDMSLGMWETNTSFEFYGGDACISESDAREADPKGNYRSGELLAKGLFAEESSIDGTWVTFGPFDVSQGESINEFADYRFFKLLVEGSTGNDGNMYEVFVSKEKGANVSIKNSTLFYYELTYLDINSEKLSRQESKLAMGSEILLPVTLAVIDKQVDYDITITPDE